MQYHVIVLGITSTRYTRLRTTAGVECYHRLWWMLSHQFGRFQARARSQDAASHPQRHVNPAAHSPIR